MNIEQKTALLSEQCDRSSSYADERSRIDLDQSDLTIAHAAHRIGKLRVKLRIGFLLRPYHGIGCRSIDT